MPKVHSYSKTLQNANHIVHSIGVYFQDQCFKHPEKAETITMKTKSIMAFYTSMEVNDYCDLRDRKTKYLFTLIKQYDILWDMILDLWKTCDDTKSLELYKEANDENDINC